MTGDFFALKYSMCYSRCNLGFGGRGMRLIRRVAPHNDKEVKDDTARYFDC